MAMFTDATSLYVGDLPNDITKDTIMDIFKDFKPFNAKVVQTKVSFRQGYPYSPNRPLKETAYAFVNFQSSADAESARHQLNYKLINGKYYLRIMTPERDPTRRNTGIGNVFVKFLEPEIDTRMVYEAFRGFGEILSCKVVTDENNRSNGYGFVHFKSEEDARKAIESSKQQGFKIINNELKVDKFISRTERQKKQKEEHRNSFTNLFVNNIDPGVDEQEFRNTFKDYGNITSMKLEKLDERKKKGFVNFTSHEEALKAMEFHNKKSDQRIGKADPYETKIEREQKKQEERKDTWTNLFVKNIDQSITEEGFINIFQKYGKILSSKLVKNDRTGSNRTLYGFINFSSHKEADTAYQDLHGKKFGTHLLWCGPHIRQEEREKKNARGTNLYIKYLDDRIDEQRLEREFSQPHFSPIKNVKIARDEKGNSKGFGFVSLTTPEGAAIAIQDMHKKILYINNEQTKPLYVALHEKKDERLKKLTQSFLNQYQPARLAVYYPPIYSQPTVPQPQFQRYKYPPPWPAPLSMPPSSAWNNNNIPNQKFAQSRPRSNIPQPQRGGRSNVPPTNQGIRRTPSENITNELTSQTLSGFPPEQQRLLLGERLYPLIQKAYPSYAGKVTGMLLDSGWNIEELLMLLRDEDRLNIKVNEAINLLKTERRIPDLTLDYLRQFPPDQQKIMLGDRLYPLIQSYQPELVAKITGMLLDSNWQIEEILSLLYTPDKLVAAINEAVEALGKIPHQQ